MGDMSYNPRYAAYAARHGLEPEAMLEADRQRFPGGCMAGFFSFIGEGMRQFRRINQLNPAAFCGDSLTEIGHTQFTAFLNVKPITHIDGNELPATGIATALLKHGAESHSGAWEEIPAGRMLLIVVIWRGLKHLPAATAEYCYRLDTEAEKGCFANCRTLVADARSQRGERGDCAEYLTIAAGAKFNR
jgi:hypothetical protein